MTQADLARRAGLSQPALARLEDPDYNPTGRGHEPRRLSARRRTIPSLVWSVSMRVGNGWLRGALVILLLLLTVRQPASGEPLGSPAPAGSGQERLAIDDLPTIGDVYARVSGEDELDTIVQRQNVLQELAKIVRVIAQDVYRISAREENLSVAYFRASQDLQRAGTKYSGPGGQVAYWKAAAATSNRVPDYQLRLLRALAPKLVELYQRRIALDYVYQKTFGGPNTGMARTNPPLPKSLSTPQDERSRKLAIAKAAAAAEASNTPPVPPDPSVATAAQAGVEMTIFGLQLGRGLNLPVCIYDEPKAPVDEPCFPDRPSDEKLASASGKKRAEEPLAAMGRALALYAGMPLGADWRDRRIVLASKDCPTWMPRAAACTITGSFLEGVLQAVQVPVEADKAGAARKHLENTYSAKNLKMVDRRLERAFAGLHVELSAPKKGAASLTFETATFHAHRRDLKDLNEASAEAAKDRAAQPVSSDDDDERRARDEYDRRQREQTDESIKRQREHDARTRQHYEELERYRKSREGL
jgi:hypothetical protein